MPPGGRASLSELYVGDVRDVIKFYVRAASELYQKNVSFGMVRNYVFTSGIVFLHFVLWRRRRSLLGVG